ncbi:MAG: universal stress protein [Chitinophagaceae bacterium]
MKVIIAPTDFSRASKNAVRFAADLACSVNAELYLLHVCQIYTIANILAEPLRRERILKEADDAIQGLHEEIIQRTGKKIPVQTAIVEGEVVPSIRSFSARVRPSFVVMGTHGLSEIGMLFFGSTTVLAMNELQWPLLMVPPEVPFREFKRIGVACDFRKIEQGFPAAEIRELKERFDATIEVVHVKPPYEEPYPVETVEAAMLLQDMLHELKPSWHFIDGESVRQGLVGFTRGQNLDLLVVVPKKHRVFEGMRRRSYSRAIAMSSPVPLLSIHQ